MKRQIMGMKNTYTIYKYVDGEKKVLAHFHNLITARMRQQLAASNGMRIHSIWFGNGSQEPTEADTALTSPLWTFSWNYGNIVSVETPELDTDNTWNIRCTAKIDATSEFVGTVSEIGIYITTGNPGLGMGTHALIKDAEGNPMTITKTDTEVLFVDIHIKYTFTSSSGFEWTPWYYYLMGEGASSQDRRLQQRRDTVWIECEVEGNQLQIFDRNGLRTIPHGWYQYRTRPGQPFPWVISDRIRLLRPMEQAEVETICAAHGVVAQQLEP